MRAFRPILPLVLPLLICGCSTVANLLEEPDAPPKPAATVTGQITYREKLLLSPGATLRASLQDVSRADAKAGIVAEDTKPLPVKPPPYPFTLTFDPDRIDDSHRYVVRAEIRDNQDRLAFTTTQAYPVITGGAPRTIDLTLEAVGHPAADAVESPWAEAKARNVTFRGIGQEPGWVVEIVEGRTIALDLDYGATRLEAAAPKPEQMFNGWRYVVETPPVFSVEIIDRRCQDAMSGEEFPSVTKVYLSGRVLEGCGRRL